VTSLELQQRGLLDLVKGRGAPPSDPYLQKVAASAGLEMVRYIAVWWRVFALESQCRLTSRLLRRRGIFEQTVEAYFNQNRTSTYIEQLSWDFLSSLMSCEYPVLRALAQFEYAMLKAQAGFAETTEILWDRHPDRTVRALESGDDLPLPEAGTIYRMKLAPANPLQISCIREVNHVSPGAIAPSAVSAPHL
jgi:hypothetical protein